MAFLILMAIHKLTPATNPTYPEGFVKELKKADAENWATEGISVFGGAYYKVLRWSFEMQGAYPRPGAPRPVTAPGDPEAVDVYIEDGRHGQYQYQSIHWNNTSIWNRRDPDGKPTHEPPVPGKPSYAYVRIRNRGTETATNIRIRGYHCSTSELE